MILIAFKIVKRNTTIRNHSLYHTSGGIVRKYKKSGTEVIRTQIQPSKPKQEITNITNRQNAKRTYGQPSEQLFHKRWHFSNRNRTKNDMNTHKVKRHINYDTKTGNREPQQNYRLGIVSNELLGGGGGLKHHQCFTAPTSPSVSEVVQNI